MAVLITETVAKNAQKCETCAMRMLGKGIDRNSIFYFFDLHEGAKLAAENVFKMSCKFCSKKKDFEKVHGMSPFEYYTEREKT